MHVTALRAAAAAFKRDARMRQLHSGSLRPGKRKRDGEQVEMAELKRPEKVWDQKAIVQAVFNSFSLDMILLS